MDAVWSRRKEEQKSGRCLHVDAGLWCVVVVVAASVARVGVGDVLFLLCSVVRCSCFSVREEFFGLVL